MNSRTTGYVFAVLQAILYSTMGIICKCLYGMGLQTPQIMVLRFGWSFVILGGFLLIWRKQPLISRQWLVYVQGIFFVASSLTYFLAVKYLW